MIRRTAEGMAFFFVKRGAIEKEDKDIYIYGSELLISEIICTLLVVVISLCTGKFIETVIYLWSYIMLRVYAGGYHASSHRNCITIFNLCYIGVLCIVEALRYFDILKLLDIVTFIATIIIFSMAPIEDLRKPLDKEEKYIYRKKSRKRVLLLFLFVIIMNRIFPQFKGKVCYGAIAICEVSLLLLVGYIKNKRVIYHKEIM